eukprot:3804449-Rhodomonas_salina.3
MVQQGAVGGCALAESLDALRRLQRRSLGGHKLREEILCHLGANESKTWRGSATVRGKYRCDFAEFGVREELHAGVVNLESGLDDVLVGEAERRKPHALRSQVLHDAGNLDAVGGCGRVGHFQDSSQPRGHVGVGSEAAKESPEVEVSVVSHEDLKLLRCHAPVSLGVAAPDALHARVGEAVRVRFEDSGGAGGCEARVSQEKLALGAKAFLVGLGFSCGL